MKNDFISDDAGTDDDGEANDPEFDYIAEAALEEEDVDEVLFNKPTKISSKFIVVFLFYDNTYFGQKKYANLQKYLFPETMICLDIRWECNAIQCCGKRTQKYVKVWKVAFKLKSNVISFKPQFTFFSVD